MMERELWPVNQKVQLLALLQNSLKALYTHCASHRLNLCVVKCSIRKISNMMQSADKVSHFFSISPKRQLALEKWIDDLFTHERQKKLKEMCRTRWIEQHEAFESFLDLFMPIVCCLEEVANSSPAEWNAETRSDAQSLFLTVFRFSFVVALVFTQKILSYIKGVSVKLQGRYVDIARAHTEIENVKSTLYKLRSDVERFHTQTYNEVLVLCQLKNQHQGLPTDSNIDKTFLLVIPVNTLKEHHLIFFSSLLSFSPQK